MKKQKLLFLAHRFPFPPDKGDKIRALNILDHLAGTYEIFLGCLDGDAEGVANTSWAIDRGYHTYCGVAGKFRRMAQTGISMLNGKPLSTGYFRHDGLQRWVSRVLADHHPELIYVYSSAMAQYVERDRPANTKVIMDFVDVDSVKWKQFASTKNWTLSWLYELEARRLLEHDRHVAMWSDASLFVSEAEMQVFRDLAPETRNRLSAVSNGVDTSFFDPAIITPSGNGNGKTIVFVGVMDYWPNVEAVQWFANEVFPIIRAGCPEARFQIVGSKPTAAVLALAEQANIEVTGAVADVRPFIANAKVVVTPLRIARGIQNKVLEGMAMAKTVVTTPAALEGIPATPGVHVLVASETQQFAELVLSCLDEKADQGIGNRARAFVINHFSWRAQLRALDNIIIQIDAKRQ